MEEVAQKSKLNFRTKFFYGFGSISFGIKNNGFSYFVLFVYSSVLGLPAWMAGLALNLVLIADAITDPLVGTIPTEPDLGLAEDIPSCMQLHCLLR